MNPFFLYLATHPAAGFTVLLVGGALILVGLAAFAVLVPLGVLVVSRRGRGLLGSWLRVGARWYLARDRVVEPVRCCHGPGEHIESDLPAGPEPDPAPAREVFGPVGFDFTGRVPLPQRVPARTPALDSPAPAWGLDPLGHALGADGPSARAVTAAVDELIVWAWRHPAEGGVR